MEPWFVLLLAFCVAALAISIFTPNRRLPPGPPFAHLIFLRYSIFNIEPLLRRLRSHYGPLISFQIGRRHVIFVASHSLAHQALVQNGAVFSDRPSKPIAVTAALNRPMKQINSSSYGPTWRLLRRNLTQEILNPSRVKAHSGSRRWVVSHLVSRLIVSSQKESSIILIDHFRHAIFCLLLFMCFGNRPQEDKIHEVEAVQQRILTSFQRFSVFNFWPKLGRFLFRLRWKELIKAHDDQNRVLVPLIRDRIQKIKGVNQQSPHKNRDNPDGHEGLPAYVDTFVDLHLPEENRKLDEEEMVTLCGEFLSAGTDTTSTSLQWIMANLVKNPQLQQKLYQEIVETIPTEASTIEEEDLHKMPYLKAVILEALRIHPPGHFLLPHRTTQDAELGGYVIPEDAIVNFMVAEMGRDGKVWEDPMEFKPERFMGMLGEGFDVTGSKEIKMMPFGAGRRICPGWGVALLHLEYFVANLVWKFKFSEVDGGVDLTEKVEFTVVMEKPLQVRISPRI